MSGWTIVVPVKGTRSAKSRLGGTAELALAIALDTVSAALEVADTVIVVTSTGVAEAFSALGAAIVADPGGGLDGAVAAGIAAVDAGPGHAGSVAVMLGDLPALLPHELAAALELADGMPRGVVPDADGDGSVLITATAGASHRPMFGPASRAAHLGAGYVEIVLPAASGLRRDVDTREQLAALAAEGRLGVRTMAALG